MLPGILAEHGQVVVRLLDQLLLARSPPGSFANFRSARPAHPAAAPGSASSRRRCPAADYRAASRTALPPGPCPPCAWLCERDHHLEVGSVAHHLHAARQQHRNLQQHAELPRLFDHDVAVEGPVLLYLAGRAAAYTGHHVDGGCQRLDGIELLRLAWSEGHSRSRSSQRADGCTACTARVWLRQPVNGNKSGARSSRQQPGQGPRRPSGLLFKSIQHKLQVYRPLRVGVGERTSTTPAGPMRDTSNTPTIGRPADASGFVFVALRPVTPPSPWTQSSSESGSGFSLTGRTPGECKPPRPRA